MTTLIHFSTPGEPPTQAAHRSISESFEFLAEVEGTHHELRASDYSDRPAHGLMEAMESVQVVEKAQEDIRDNLSLLSDLADRLHEDIGFLDQRVVQVVESQATLFLKRALNTQGLLAQKMNNTLERLEEDLDRSEKVIQEQKGIIEKQEALIAGQQATIDALTRAAEQMLAVHNASEGFFVGRVKKVGSRKTQRAVQ